jgi:hypothetical protein
MFKNKYKSFLKDIIVDKRVERNIDELHERKRPKKNKTMVAYYARKEGDELETEQMAIGMKLRDNKTRYMRRMYIFYDTANISSRVWRENDWEMNAGNSCSWRGNLRCTLRIRCTRSRENTSGQLRF